MDHTLTALATRDYRQLCELYHESKPVYLLFRRLSDPVRKWRNDMGRFVGSERLLVGSLRLKRNCEREVNLDDEGEIDYAMAREERSRMWEKINHFRRGRSVCAA